MPPYDAWNAWCSICESPWAVKIDSSVSPTAISSSSGNSAVKSEQTFHVFPYELLPAAISITLALTSCYFEQPLNERVSCTWWSQLSQWSFFYPHTEMQLWCTSSSQVRSPPWTGAGWLSRINFWKEHRDGAVNPDICKVLEYVGWTGGVLMYPTACQCSGD